VSNPMRRYCLNEDIYVYVCVRDARVFISVCGGTRRLRRCLWEFMLALIHGSELDPASLLVLCSRLTAGNNERATQRRDNEASDSIMTARRRASLRHYSYRHLRRAFPLSCSRNCCIIFAANIESTKHRLRRSLKNIIKYLNVNRCICDINN